MREISLFKCLIVTLMVFALLVPASELRAQVGLLPISACGNGVQSDGELCFHPPSLATVSEGDPSGVAVGFLNNDSHRDFVMSNTGTDQIRIKLGDGNGAFPWSYFYSMGDGPTDVAIADFNADGFKDIIATNIYASRVRIRWGDTNWFDST